jgi:uncharacterized membrane protein (DUF485 family)
MKEQRHQYKAIAQSTKFKELMAQKKKFIVSMSVLFLLFYFMLPVFTSYFEFLNKSALGPITWAWVYAFAQFIMTWGLCWLYTKKAAKYDQIIKEIKADLPKKEEKTL